MENLPLLIPDILTLESISQRQKISKKYNILVFCFVFYYSLRDALKAAMVASAIIG